MFRVTDRDAVGWPRNLDTGAVAAVAETTLAPGQARSGRVVLGRLFSLVLRQKRYRRRNVLHARWEKARVGPIGCLESRTATSPPGHATSTQPPLPPSLKLLLRQVRLGPAAWFMVAFFSLVLACEVRKELPRLSLTQGEIREPVEKAPVGNHLVATFQEQTGGQVLDIDHRVVVFVSRPGECAVGSGMRAGRCGHNPQPVGR